MTIARAQHDIRAGARNWFLPEVAAEKYAATKHNAMQETLSDYELLPWSRPSMPKRGVNAEVTAAWDLYRKLFVIS